MVIRTHSTDASRASPPVLPIALTDATQRHQVTMIIATKANAKDKDKTNSQSQSQSQSPR